LIGLIVGGFAVALSFSPSRPPPLAAIEGAKDQLLPIVDELPPIDKLDVSYGSPIAFRRYAGQPGGGWAIVLHGSSGSSVVMHPLSKALAGAGISVYAIDLRGHGETAPHGDLDFRGELEDDIAALASLATREHPGEKRLLIGHSLGGSLTLRIDAEPVSAHFDGFIPLSPFVAGDFPGYRTNSGGWVGVALPRIVAITILDRIGISAFDGLPVIAYAVPANDERGRTTFYSNRLLENCSFPRDWQSELPKATKPTHVMIGGNDELFIADAYPAAMHRYAPDVTVEIVPGVGHMGMVLDKIALDRVVASAKAMVGRT
jgi:pimeloyl-ACP methyl ester carboxylesterase